NKYILAIGVGIEDPAEEVRILVLSIISFISAETILSDAFQSKMLLLCPSWNLNICPFFSRGIRILSNRTTVVGLIYLSTHWLFCKACSDISQVPAYRLVLWPQPYSVFPQPAFWISPYQPSRS